MRLRTWCVARRSSRRICAEGCLMIERAMQWQSLVSARSLLLARARECFCAILRGTWRALQIDAKNRLPTVHEIIKNVKEVSGDFLLSRVHERGLKIENECV